MKWFLYLIPSLLVDLAAIVLAPFVVAIGRVPQWMMTSDNPIEGDAGHQARWAGKSKYRQKVAWLWRNKAYGFTKFNAKGIDVFAVEERGNPAVSDKPYTPGWCLRRVGPYWHLYAIVPYFGRFVRVNLGWKLWRGPNFGQYVATINPCGKQP